MSEAGVRSRRGFSPVSPTREGRKLPLRRWLGCLIRVAAREPVDRFFDGVHGHVQFLALHSRRDHRLRAHLAVAGDQLHPASGLDSAFAGSSGDTSIKVHGVFCE